MRRYLLIRFLSVPPVLFGVTVICFLLMHLIPGDPVQTILGSEATPEAVAALRSQLALDRPLYEQYLRWLGNLLSGRWGMSYSLHVPISELLFPKLANTLILAGASLVFCVVVGVSLGTLAGLRSRSWFDRITMAAAQVAASMPVFWVGLLLMWVFAIQLGWLPTGGMHDLRSSGGIGDLLVHLVLPAVATALVSTAVIARLTRSVVADILEQDFVRYYRSLGIEGWSLTVRHVLRNALPPILNMIGLQVGYLIGGSLFSEVVFNWPGLGRQMYTAISAKDYPMVQAGIFVIAVMVVLINFAVDTANIMLNPRQRTAVS
ncbi:ABC transporter permease [Kyrpidia spormannii]|uniref:Glutathione ABC transporter permease GsiC n=2 Tax=Kyrpidia spormannii TaxID=2055160 RepID=A0ACA8ZDB0_9BACL|nr:ABC transporter permease [Kyrpidia spormannii]CAB3394754.1 Glutathione ABC transporter permease GsiC [Kyrpidia spormannii]CAB3395721.1 Glutathione ABC transporter permease GsiC [Kyrpidia spormannii]